MKVLYSTQAVVEYDGSHYYSNAVQSSYKKYLDPGDNITVFSYGKTVVKSNSDMVDEDVKFVQARKVNSLKGMMLGDDGWNDKQAEELVKGTDVCVVNLPCAHSYQVINYAKKYGKPYLTIVVGCPWDALWNFDWRGKLLAPMEYFRMRSAMKHANYSIYVTNVFLQRRYPTNGEFIGCSDINVSTGEEEALEKRMNHIRQLNHEGRSIRIGTAAAIDVPYKGQEYVIKALGLLKQDGIKMEYHLIGTGNTERLKKIAEEADIIDQVVFRGAIPHSDVLEFMDTIDVYIQPSKQEGLPRALIEAMSRGCLCLGSNIAGIPELLESAFLFSKGNVSQIVSVLKKISIESLAEQAKRNFDVAKQYDCELLNLRRKEFIEEFRKSCANE